MGMEIRDERGRLLYSTDPEANPVPPKNSIQFRKRDVPMIALKKFRPPGGSGNCWPGDTFNLLPGEVDHFERHGLAKRKSSEVAAPVAPEPESTADSEETESDSEETESDEEETDPEPTADPELTPPETGGPTRAKVERRHLKRKHRR